MGRAMILPDRQLRAFNIQQPWSLEAALEHSASAAASWGYEHSTPPLRSPPSLSISVSDALKDIFDFIPPPEAAEFNYTIWWGIEAKTDRYIAGAGNLRTSAHAYTARWWRGRNPTALTPIGLALFEGVVSDELYDYSVRVEAHWVLPAGTECGSGSHMRHTPMSTTTL